MELFITALFFLLHLVCAASVVERDTIVIPAPDGPYGVDATQVSAIAWIGTWE